MLSTRWKEMGRMLPAAFLECESLLSLCTGLGAVIDADCVACPKAEASLRTPNFMRSPVGKHKGVRNTKGSGNTKGNTKKGNTKGSERFRRS